MFKEMLKEIIESPEFEAAKNKTVDEVRANFLLMSNGFKELMNKGYTLKQAKVLIEARFGKKD